MQVGDLVKNIHGLYPANMGIIIEVCEEVKPNPNSCPYKVHWLGRGPRGWMRADWMEKVDD